MITSHAAKSVAFVMEILAGRCCCCQLSRTHHRLATRHVHDQKQLDAEKAVSVQFTICSFALWSCANCCRVCSEYAPISSVCTGEIMPDAGNAYICGHSMQREMARARQLVGYCPQFDALPGTLTGISPPPAFFPSLLALCLCFDCMLQTLCWQLGGAA